MYYTKIKDGVYIWRVTMFDYKVLRRLRENKGLSSGDLVFDLHRLGLRISHPTLINWEKGRTEPKISQVYRLSKFFGVPLEKFCKDI